MQPQHPKNSKIKTFLTFVARVLLKTLFRVEIRGMEYYEQAGSRVLILPNHVSLLDAALVALFLPVPPLFAVNLFTARLWWVRFFLSFMRTWPIDPTNPFALKALIAEIRNGGHCVIFPEGRITTTGGLMKIYDGAAMLADKTNSVLLPLRIEGASLSKLSYLKGKFPQCWFPKITLTFSPPQILDFPKELRGRKRREQVRIFLYDLMREAAFKALDHRKTLFQALLEARKLYGGKRIVAIDSNRKPADYNAITLATLLLGHRFASLTQHGEYVGILMPGSIATVALTIGLGAMRRVPAMLNYTVGAKNMLSCCTAAQISTVITSRRFIEAAKFSSLIDSLQCGGLKVIYLEDIAENISIWAKMHAWLKSRTISIHSAAGDPDAPALVLFTSGSEGTPKGVVLSHSNVIANRNQLVSSIDFNPSDVVMNAMPMFHVFGYVVGTLMPLLSGIRTFYYPTPLHYRIIPLVAYDIDATVIFGTDTFLYGYARNAHPYDFYRIRYAFAGAEKLRERTRQLWGEKFGIRIIEGYGTTETSIVSANTPLQFRLDTVGRIMPGMTWHLEAIPGIEEGGRLHISGPNIMLGYLKSEHPGTIQAPPNGSYDTGDIVAFDEFGFMRIQGRAKRFAKIGGEMISLISIEESIERIWPGARHAVIALEDERKGEQLVLFTEYQEAKRDQLSFMMKAAGYTEVSIPKKIITLRQMPLLGSGKTDYSGIIELLKTTVGSSV